MLIIFAANALKVINFTEKFINDFCPMNDMKTLTRKKSVKKSDVEKAKQKRVPASLTVPKSAVNSKSTEDSEVLSDSPLPKKLDFDEELLGRLLSEDDEKKNDEDHPPESEEDGDRKESPYTSGEKKGGRYGGKTEAHRSEKGSRNLYVKDFSEDETGYLGGEDLDNESVYDGRGREEERDTVYSSSQGVAESDAFSMDGGEGASNYVEEADLFEQPVDVGQQVSSQYIERVETSVSSGDYASAKENVLETADYMSGKNDHSCGGCAVNTIYSLRGEVLGGTYAGDFDASSILDAVDRLAPTLEQFRGMHTHQRQLITGGIG